MKITLKKRPKKRIVDPVAFNAWLAELRKGRGHVIRIKLVSEANQREHHMVRHKRKVCQQHCIRTSILGIPHDPAKRLRVTITRYGAGTMDSHDNLKGSAKHVIDAIAKIVGIDDGSPFYEWVVKQEKSPPLMYAVRVVFEVIEIQEKA